MKKTIAIKNASNAAFAIEAEIIDICGFSIGVHRSLSGTGWAATFVGVGIAAAIIISGGTRAAVIELARTRIERAGVELITSKLEKLELLPAAETLPTWKAPEKPVAPTINVEAVVSQIQLVAGLTDEEATAVRGALSSKGKNVGRLKAKCPSAFGGVSDRLAAAAWQGLQPNSFKISVSTILFLQGPSRALFEKLSSHKWPLWLDSDASVLDNLGVW